ELEVGKLRRQFLLNLTGERAPLCQEPGLECGVKPLHEVSSILEADSRQQRVLLSQVIKNLVDDRLRHDHIHAFQRLPRVAGLHGFNQLVVILDLFAGQNPHAAASQDLSVTCLHNALSFGDYRLLYRVGKLNKGLSKGFLVVVLDSFLHLGRKFGLLLFKQIKVLHFSSSPSLSFEANASRKLKRPLPSGSGSPCFGSSEAGLSCCCCAIRCIRRSSNAFSISSLSAARGSLTPSRRSRMSCTIFILAL